MDYGNERERERERERGGREREWERERGHDRLNDFNTLIDWMRQRGRFSK